MTKLKIIKIEIDRKSGERERERERERYINTFFEFRDKKY